MADVPTTEKPEYQFDAAARARAREALAIIDKMHEHKPRCRLCGQRTNRLDAFGLCPKTEPTHAAWRAPEPAPRRTRAR